MSSRIKHDDILLLEQPILKVPTDGLRSSLRSTQRIIERDYDKLNASLKEAVAQSSPSAKNESEQANPELRALDDLDGVKNIDKLLLKARGLKRKLDETYHNPQSGMGPSLSRIKARIDHLQDLYSSEYTTDSAYKYFSKTRLDRHLVDFMLRSGYTDSAQSLSQVAGIEMLVDTPLFAELARIEKALAEHSCSEALAWCKENAGTLKKMQSTLEFDLRYQEFIELTKAKKFNEAISYSQKQLVPWTSTHLAEISQVMALLAFDKRTTCPPYARLYDESRWNDLLTRFRSTLFALLSIPEQPFLHLSLSVGLASLKLPACYSPSQASGSADPANEDIDMTPSFFPSRSSTGLAPASRRSSTTAHHPPIGGPLTSPSNFDPTLVQQDAEDDGRHHRAVHSSQRNPDCPTCDPHGLGELAKECPWSHHVNSIIVCGLTGKVVNDGDGLAVLPNGRVYSGEGLEQMADKDNGRVRCPKTGQVYGIDEIRRVFIS